MRKKIVYMAISISLIGVQSVGAAPEESSGGSNLKDVHVFKPVTTNNGITELQEVKTGKPLAPAETVENKPPATISDPHPIPGSTPYKPIPAVSGGKIELEEVKPGTPVQAIPPATAGNVEMKELRSGMTLEVTASKSRVFRTKAKIIRVAVSDPSIAEPVVVAEREFILMGKRDGTITLMLWFDSK